MWLSMREPLFGKPLLKVHREYAHRNISAPSIRNRPAAYPGVWPPPVGDGHAENDLIRPGRIGDHNGHGVEMIEGPDLIFVAQWQIDGCAQGRQLSV